MPSILNHQRTSLDQILVIDDLPLIPLGFQEIFRTINPSATVRFSENIFTALSAKTYANTTFDMVITGSFREGCLEHLQQDVNELKQRFGQPLVMVYSTHYDPAIIEKMAIIGIDAYVHKFESVEEIKKACRHLSKGGSFISEIFHTLYYEYR